MATELSDADIERLLSEAEVRLAAAAQEAPQDQDASLVPASAPAAVVTVTAPAPSGETKVQPAIGKKGDKLSVRAPSQPKKKGKPDSLDDWYGLPRTDVTPELRRDLQVLRMRDVVAGGKQFFKKDSSRPLIPEYAQVGTIIAGATDTMNNRLTRKERKRTIVEEVLSAENLEKFKSKYHVIQEKNASGKRRNKKMMARKNR